VGLGVSLMVRGSKRALVACASVLLVGASAPPGARTFIVPLTGEAETNLARPNGGTGDPNGFGIVRLAVNPDNKQVCFEFKLSGLSQPFMAHIHQGGPLANGPPIIALFTGIGTPLRDCAPSTRSQLTEIVGNPSGFYVSVDTLEFPDGAVRGQL